MYIPMSARRSKRKRTLSFTMISLRNHVESGEANPADMDIAPDHAGDGNAPPSAGKEATVLASLSNDAPYLHNLHWPIS